MWSVSQKDAVYRDHDICIRSDVPVKPIEARGSVGKVVGEGESSRVRIKYCFILKL